MKKTLLLALLASGVVAGCGGGDSNEALSYDGFVDAANAACIAASDDIESVTEGLTGDPKNDLPVFEDLIPALEDASASLDEIDPPEELQAAFDDFKAATDKQVEGALDAQTAAEAGDQAEYQRILEDLGPVGEETDVAANAMGAEDCIG